MPEPNKTRIKSFATADAYGKWLKANHESETELWLKIYKKGSGVKTINWGEVVVESLCWGWIDGFKKSLDDQAYLQRVTPRRSGSSWSIRNREHVEKLISENRMQDPGLRQIRAAQADGRWDAAYSPASEMTIPDDFLSALNSCPKALQFFATLNKTNLYSIGYRLQTAKKPETRQKLIVKFVAMMKNGETFH